MKQHSTPLVVHGQKIERVERVDLSSSEYNESWLQGVVAQNASALPIDEIEPAFSNQVSLCTELPAESGYCDHVLINEDGYITLIEYKLWRNPEARRKAISQILDYAKDISKWSFAKFEENCLRARKGKEQSLYEVLEQFYPEIDERVFIDNTQRNLSQARFLLLLVGDGIRENVEELASFLHQFGNMNFTLSMIEIPVYKLSDGRVLLTPRVLAKTTEIVRSIIKIDRDGNVSTASVSTLEKASSNSEREFIERLSTNTGRSTADNLKSFSEELYERFGVSPRMGRGKQLSYNLKSADNRFNFASIQEAGEIWFYGIVTKTDEIGARDIGVSYLKQLAEIVNAEFDDSYADWNWCVRRKGQYLLVTEYLQHKDEWKELIGDTLKRIAEHEEMTL